jgi:heme exporter protein D
VFAGERPAFAIQAFAAINVVLASVRPAAALINPALRRKAREAQTAEL